LGLKEKNIQGIRRNETVKLRKKNSTTKKIEKIEKKIEAKKR